MAYMKYYSKMHAKLLLFPVPHCIFMERPHGFVPLFPPRAEKRSLSSDQF
jgi:hypothetical protein